MDRQYIHDHQVIERYLQGRLTSTEQEAFEAHLLSDPVVLDELELTERIRQGMQDIGDPDQLRSSVAGNGPPRWLWMLSSPRYAAAASVMLVASLVFSGAVYRQNVDLREAQPLVAQSSVTRRVPLQSVRGAAANVVPARSDEEWTVLLVDPGLEYAVYRASVMRREQEASVEVWQQSGLEVGYDGDLAIGLPGRVLTPGEYEVRIAGRMSDWPAGRGFEESRRIPFRITP